MNILQRFLLSAVFISSFFALAPRAEAGAPPIWVDARYGISNPDASNGVAAFQDTLNGQPAFGQVTGTGIFDLGSTDDQVLGQAENTGTLDSAFVAWGTDFQSTGMYQIFISRVTAGAEDWNVDITGASFFYGNSAVIKMIPDGSGGVFVLASDGAVGPFGETSGGPTLVYIDSTGNIDFTDGPYGYNNADMVPAGAGAVMVVSNLGYNADDLVQAYEHGIVRRYDTSGLDATFAGGAGFVNLSTSLTEKRDLFAIADGGDGLIAFWSSDTGTQGIYAQHIDFEGVQDGNWDPNGELLVAGSNLTVLSAFDNGFGLYYMAFADSTNDEIRVFAFDDFSDSYWACTPLVTNQSDVTNGNEVGILPDDDGLYVFWQYDSAGDQGLYGQFYDIDGHTLGTLGGELIDDADANGGSNFDVVFQDDFSGSVSPATPRVSALKRTVSDHAQVYVSYFDGANDIVERIIVTSASFTGGPGNDCAGITPPDAIIDLGAVAGDEEVDLSWTEPADNGDAIIDYTIEYGETAGFPGNAAVFVDGVNTLTDVTVTGLTNGTDYSFRVFAENGGGLSASSNVATATPMGLANGRRRNTIEVQGPQIFLGRLQEFLNALRSSFSTEGGVYGSAGVPSSDEVSYQTEDGGASQRSFSEDEYLRSQIQPQKENLLKLLDLIIQLRQLFGWMNPDDAQLLKQHRSLKQAYDRLFLTRYFHQMTGIEYLERGPGKVYDFDYRDPIQRPTEIVADFQKSILLSYGKACYGEEVLRYAEEIDFVGNPDWYQRYVFIMKPWMDVVLAKNDYVQWTSTRGIDVLESLYLFLFGYCLADELL
ncbi:MAG: fibronectin type III domain-containing protein [Candidatus Altimarinota bacterium]